MITLKRISSPDCIEYSFTETLLTKTFPRDEYRNLDQQRNNVATKKEFHLMIATNSKDTPVGFVSYWLLNDFCYIEHLAILPVERCKGYGEAILKQLQERIKKIVLEVEEPIDIHSKRRIDFYCRQGFELCKIPYIQPPYRKEGNSLQMLLMFYGWAAEKKNYEEAKKHIYSNIYNIKQL